MLKTAGNKTRMLSGPNQASNSTSLFAQLPSAIKEPPNNQAWLTTRPVGIRSFAAPRSTSVTYSRLPENVQGMGLGRKMYGGSIRKAFQDFSQGNGPRFFTSDYKGSTSEPASRVWDSLRRAGYPVMDNKALGSSLRGTDAMHGIDLSKMRSFYGDGAKPPVLKGVANSVMNGIVAMASKIRR